MRKSSSFKNLNICKFCKTDLWTLQNDLISFHVIQGNDETYLCWKHFLKYEELYDYFKLMQWSWEREIWIPILTRFNESEFLNSKEFIKKFASQLSQKFDAGCVWIFIDPLTAIKFKYFRHQKSIYLDDQLYVDGMREKEYFKVLFKLKFPDFKFYPQTGMLP